MYSYVLQVHHTWHVSPTVPSLLPKSQRAFHGIALPKIHDVGLTRNVKISYKAESHITGQEARDADFPPVEKSLPSRGKKSSLPRKKTFRRERKFRHPRQCKYFSSKPPQDLCYKRTIGLPLLMYISTPIAHPGMRTQAGLHAEIRHLPASRRYDLVPWHFPWRKHGGCHYRYQFHGEIRLFEYGRNAPFIQ